MLAIRMQRTGRKGHSQFRVIVQESRLSPSSGKVVAFLGSYDPHTKATIVDTEKAAYFLEHGAQPSDRVALLLQKEGVKLPTWVKVDTTKKREIKNTEKLRRNRPAEEVAVAAEAPATEEAPAAEETPAA
jgi:small subunit ribosomal protein S16